MPDDHHLGRRALGNLLANAGQGSLRLLSEYIATGLEIKHVGTRPGRLGGQRLSEALSYLGG